MIPTPGKANLEITIPFEGTNISAAGGIVVEVLLSARIGGIVVIIDSSITLVKMRGWNRGRVISPPPSASRLIINFHT